jgi:hypothetical protein
MITNTNETMKELVTKELSIFRRFPADMKNIKWPLEWWEKHEFIFFTFGLFAC